MHKIYHEHPELSPAAKLTKEQVLQIKSRIHEPQKKLAEEFKVSISTISRIKNGSRWQNLST